MFAALCSNKDKYQNFVTQEELQVFEGGMEKWQLILIIAGASVLYVIIVVSIGCCIKFKCFKES